MKTRTNFLKLSLCIIVVAVLFFSFMFTMILINEKNRIFTELAIAYGSLYLTAVIALCITCCLFKIVSLIEKENTFSYASLHQVQIIFCLTVLEFFILLGLLPLAYYVAIYDEAPGFIFIIAGICLIPFILATFIAVIEKLLENAIKLQSENKLTI